MQPRVQKTGYDTPMRDRDPDGADLTMTKRRAWKLRPGSDDKTVGDVLKTGLIRLDYEVLGLRPEMTREELIRAIQEHNPERSDKGVGNYLEWPRPTPSAAGLAQHHEAQSTLVTELKFRTRLYQSR